MEAHADRAQYYKTLVEVSRGQTASLPRVDAFALHIQVVDSETGLAKNDSVRTSSGFFYELGEDEVRTRG